MKSHQRSGAAGACVPGTLPFADHRLATLGPACGRRLDYGRLVELIFNVNLRKTGSLLTYIKLPFAGKTHDRMAQPPRFPLRCLINRSLAESLGSANPLPTI